ncbi:glycosyltransferase family 4 protein [Candidatus Omnitrophota bacterium]
MKIGILINELAPGSAPKVIGQTFKELQKLGHQCQALALIDNSLQEEFPDIYSFHLNSIKMRYIFGKRPRWDFKFPGFSFFSLHHILSFFVAPFLIKNREYDIIIANGQFATFAAWGLKLFRGIPYIFYAHADPCTYTLKKTYCKTWLKVIYPLILIFAWLVDKLAVSGAQVSIASGRLHQERFRELTKKPFVILRLGCFSKEDFLPFSQRQKAVLTFDRWDIGNKPHIFLHLLENIDRDIKLKIGGFWHPKNLEAEFLKEVRDRGLKDRVHLLGPLNERMIMDLCFRIMLHVHPNQEAFGMQTLEAAACGCCIIVPRGSGVADLFEHSRQGYFFEENNQQELIKYVKMVFSDLDKAEAMGREAWKVARNYSWHNYAKDLEVIIKRYI